MESIVSSNASNQPAARHAPAAAGRSPRTTASFLGRWRTKGHCPARKPLTKILWSTLGGFVGILCLASLHQFVAFPEPATSWLMASYGASAVLIFGVPQADFSQPRNLVGGHLLSALVGVSVQRFLGDHPQLAAATAVALSIGVMHWTRTIHPPGGATALTAVVGGTAIQALGFQFILTPVLVGCVLLLAIALVVNNLSSNSQRHYPNYWA